MFASLSLGAPTDVYAADRQSDNRSYRYTANGRLRRQKLIPLTAGRLKLECGLAGTSPSQCAGVWPSSRSAVRPVVFPTQNDMM